MAPGLFLPPSLQRLSTVVPGALSPALRRPDLSLFRSRSHAVRLGAFPGPYGRPAAAGKEVCEDGSLPLLPYGLPFPAASRRCIRRFVRSRRTKAGSFSPCASEAGPPVRAGGKQAVAVPCFPRFRPGIPCRRALPSGSPRSGSGRGRRIAPPCGISSLVISGASCGFQSATGRTSSWDWASFFCSRMPTGS